LHIAYITDATGSRGTRDPRCAIRRASRSTVMEMADHRRSLRLVGIPSQEFATSIRIAFEQAAEAFFDPFLQVVDASRHKEARDAIIRCRDSPVISR
jgi:hypothetical protein